MTWEAARPRPRRLPMVRGHRFWSLVRSFPVLPGSVARSGASLSFPLWLWPLGPEGRNLIAKLLPGEEARKRQRIHPTWLRSGACGG
jgi:hypothetical protein